MKVLIIIGFLACAAAAPDRYHTYHQRHYPPPPPPPRDDRSSLEEYFRDDLFDTGKFWSEISRELMDFDRMLQDFNRHFQSNCNTEKIEGNDYIVQIPLPGFEESDFVIKAREGVLMIQAVHKVDEVWRQKNYLDVRSLPTFIDVKGVWTYENDVLKIVFPMKQQTTTEVAENEVTSEIPITNSPVDHSREEMEPEKSQETGDADVGVNKDIQTNEVPKGDQVEATTYSIDLKDEYEFVPIRY